MARPAPVLDSFIWGAGGEALTPEQIARQREIAAALSQQGVDTSPVGSWTQGAARVANALAGVVKERRANKAEGANTTANSSILQSLLGGGASGFPAAPSGGAFPTAPGAPMASNAAAPAIPQTAEAGAIRQGLISRGLPEHVADAFVMNFQDESGLNPGINEENPTVPGSRGGFGLYQLTGPRRREYEKFAAERGVDLADTDAQLDFLMKEGQGSEKAAFDAILAAPDTGSAAAAIVNKFLRPAESHRASREARYLNAKAPVQVASLDPSAGMTPAPDPLTAMAPGTTASAYDPSGLPPLDPNDPMAPAPADAPLPNPGPGETAVTTPAGQRVLAAMMGRQPIGGQFQGVEPSLRPFNPGERRPNPDGSYSTEISTTQQQPDGQFVNTPSLWMGRQGPVQFNPGDERGIMSEAGRFEAQNGKTFPRFPNVQAAEQAAVARSAAGGAGAPQQVAQAVPDNLPVMAGGSADALPPGQAQQSINPAIIEALSNPAASEQTRKIAGMLLGQQMESQDPANQLDMDYKRAQIGALNRKGDGSDETFFGNPVAIQGPDGNIAYGQMGNKGTFRPIQLPEGQSFAPPTKTIDTGTETILLDQAGNVISRTPKQNYQESFDKGAGSADAKVASETKSELGSIKSKMPGLYSVVDRLQELAGEATYTNTGKAIDWARKEAGMEPREAAVARAEYTAIVDNQILPLLRDTFGAQFTAEEGMRLARTLGDPDKSPTEKQALLRAFIQQKERDIQALESRSGGPIGQTETTTQPKRLKFNPTTGELE